MSGLEGQFQNTKVPRDRMSRPLLIPAMPDKKDPGKRTAYRRVTRFVSVFEDRYNLELHGQREVIWGMGARPDLVALASSVRHDWNETGEGKWQLAGNKDSIADQARDYAKSSAKANLGTALHQHCENLDRGNCDWRQVPNEYKGDLAAYHAACAKAGMIHRAIETFRVHDEWKVAGTADRIVEIGGQCYIMDIKTGKLEFDGAVLKMAMQLAMYAHSVPYDPATDTRGVDAGKINTDMGIIVHLPPGKGVCEIHWLDIGYGWRACQLAKKVWEVRDGGKTKNLLMPFDGAPPRQVVVPTSEQYKEMADVAKSVAELEYLWRSAKFFRRDTPDFVQSCARRKDFLQSQIAVSA